HHAAYGQQEIARSIAEIRPERDVGLGDVIAMEHEVGTSASADGKKRPLTLNEMGSAASQARDATLTTHPAEVLTLKSRDARVHPGGFPEPRHYTNGSQTIPQFPTQR